MPRTEFRQQLDTLRGKVLALGTLTIVACERALGALQEDDRSAAAAIVAEDRELDQRHAAIQHLAITTLATQQPAAGDLRAVTAALAVAGELERVGDYAKEICRLVLRAVDEPALQDSGHIYQLAHQAVTMLRQSLQAYATADPVLARRVWNEDGTVDAAQHTLYRELLLSMMENPSTLTRATHLLLVSHYLARVADRATNICEQVIFMAEGHWPDVQRPRSPEALPDRSLSDGDGLV